MGLGGALGIAAEVGKHAADLFAAGEISKAAFDRLTGGAGSVNSGNIDTVQQKTPYSGTAYGKEVSDLTDISDPKQQAALQNQQLFDQNLQADTRQQIFNNRFALDDQSNRAQAARDVLSNYTSARNANANFLASIAGRGGGQVSAY